MMIPFAPLSPTPAGAPPPAPPAPLPFIAALEDGLVGLVSPSDAPYPPHPY